MILQRDNYSLNIGFSTKIFLLCASHVFHLHALTPQAAT